MVLTLGAFNYQNKGHPFDHGNKIASMHYRLKFTLLLFLSSCIILFSACKGKAKQDGKAKGNGPVEVDVLIAEPRPVNSIIEVNGTVVANEFTELHPEVSGRLTYLNIPEGNPVTQGNNFFLNLNCDSLEEIERVFNAVGKSGKVLLPLQDMFWGARFGMLTDQFGVNWMFSFELEKRN